jgi:hypothetical protein
MKCLYFLYGEKRTFETARKFWNILDIPNLDIVIHTPNTTSDYLGSSNFESVTEKDFDVLGNPKVFLYERNSHKATDNHVLHYSFRFLSKYLNECGDVYDCIFIGRVDSTFYIKDLEKLLNNVPNQIYPLGQLSNNGEPLQHIPDHAFFGSHEMIKKFVDNIPNTEFFDIPGSHKGMILYLLSMFEEKYWKGFSSNHIRLNEIKYYDAYVKENGDPKLDIDKFINTFKYLNNELSRVDLSHIGLTEKENILEIEYKKQFRSDGMKDYKFENNELQKLFTSFVRYVVKQKIREKRESLKHKSIIKG